MPVSLPFSITNAFGEWLMTISTLSSSASSSSQSEALKKPRGLRAMTLTSLRAEAQRGAAAVHRGVADADDQHALADLVDVAEGDRLEPVDADVDAVACRRRPGRSSSLPFGAPEPTNTASKPPAVEQLAQARRPGVFEPQVDAHVEDHADLFVEHRRAAGGTTGMLVRIRPPGVAVLLEDRDLVAERHQIVGDGERGGTGADAGDALAVLLRRDAAAAGP